MTVGLNRIPPVFLWLAIAVSLFLNVVNVNLISQVGENGRSNMTRVCKETSKTTEVVNLANGTFHSVLQNSLDNALARINTPKELPSDKKTVQTNTEFLPKFKTAAPPNCKGFK